MKAKTRSNKEVGLTGAVASGKSEVAALLRKHGIPVFDLDDLGRSLLDVKPDLVSSIAEIAGPHVFSEGKLDRRRLRESIFADKTLKKKIEALLHPKIMERYEAERDRAYEQGKKLVVCEAALLIEAGYAEHFDALIVVMASENVRKRRLLARDSVSEFLARQMLAANVDDSARLKASTFIVRNDGSLEELEDQVHRLIDEFRRRSWIT